MAWLGNTIESWKEEISHEMTSALSVAHRKIMAVSWLDCMQIETRLVLDRARSPPQRGVKMK